MVVDCDLVTNLKIAKFFLVKKRAAAAGSRTQDTSGLSRQYSATEPRQPDNHQPSQSSICTAQVVLNASVTHLAAMQPLSMCRQNSVRGRPENSLHQERNHAEWFFSLSITLNESTTSAVHIEDCEGWWLSGCHGSVDTAGLSCQCFATEPQQPDNHQSYTDCQGWCLSSCCGSVAKHWQLTPVVCIPATADLFNCFYFRLIASTFSRPTTLHCTVTMNCLEIGQWPSAIFLLSLVEK